MILDPQLQPDETLRPLLQRVTDSFLNGAPTLRVAFRSWLHPNGSRIDDLIRTKFLEYPDANYVLPGLLTFEYISPALRTLAREGTDLVLQTLRTLYLNDLTKPGIRTDLVSTRIRREHTCDDRTLRAGIWLAAHVGVSLAGTGPWGDNWTTLPELIHVREELLDYTTIDTAWTTAIARLHAAAAGQRSPAVELTEAVSNAANEFFRDVGIEVDTARLKAHSASPEIPTIDRLPDRQKMEFDLTAHLEHSFPTSVLFIDLDGFKNVNDTLGHSAGDECLEKTVALVGTSIISKGSLYRVGGDEFAVVLSNAVLAEAVATAERIRRAIDEANPCGAVKVTTSIGVAAASGDVGTADSLLKAADEAMYGAKFSGKNRVVTWPLSSEVVHAIEEGRQNKRTDR